ncbi:unnamed protein product [Hymenolepis diminuta]|uniref:SET domain-containing protein n=1 Tax=Hymenolepis diminuta TaxID=6216 RepID=A0A564Z7I5_HYMDI|nr:unnamed protein product [Hymenolepis diminuta]
MAGKCLEWCIIHMNSNQYESAINAANRAYFCAVSRNVKFSVLQTRSRLFLEMGYYKECLYDAISALELNANWLKNRDIYSLISECFKKLNYVRKSKFYESRGRELRDLSVTELKEDITKLRLEINDFYNYKSKWTCIHPEFPENSIDKSGNICNMNNKEQQSDTSETPIQLLSAKEGVLRAKNTKSDRGWTLEVTRDVSVGEILLTERPYASILGHSYTKYCYCCYKRCLNIRPCKGCAMVGFCSKECAENARNPDRSLLDGGPGRHVFDCGGIIPFIRLEDNFGVINPGLRFSHLAYTCVANTPAEVLLDHICSTDENQRHQGFENVDNSRGQPPPVFNPSDYSTVAWLYPQSGTETTDEFQWKSTINAIFLTYCLWLSDYPMRWFDEAKREFYKHPSQIKRPNFLPASWIATCMLYHLKAMRFNAADYTEYLESSSIELTSNRNWLALCIYPTISLINHDCNPNACLVSTANGGTFLYALRPIAKNEEVTICYQYFYFSISTSFRIANIRERYLFSCHCDACSNKWDLKKLETESLKCPSCGSKFLSTDEKCTNCNDEGSIQSVEVGARESQELYFLEDSELSLQRGSSS